MSLNVELLESSFEQIKPCAGDFATSFYENLFSANPEAKPLFANTDLAEQKKKLVASLVLVVENLRKPDVLEGALKGLGARHVQYGALPEHYPLVGSAILTTFEQYLGEDWTDEVKQAWVEAYGAITELMLSGADYDSKVVELDSEAAAEPEATEPVAVDETLTQTTEASDTINETEPEVAEETTEESGLKVSLLENSFEQIKPRAGEFAASFYENLFRMYPAAQPLFANTDLAEQQKKLVASLVLVVENLRKPDALESPLKGLGARHVQYGALPEHYPLVGNALLTTFEQYLGNDWTNEVKQAWVEAYGAITEIMLSGADYDSAVVALDSVAAAEPETPVAESDTIDETEPEVAAETLTETPTETTEESGLKVSLLESSFEQIKPRAGEFAASFYENLFRMYPAAQPLFANTDLAEQQKKLVASLVLVVENLRKPDALESPLKGLGARHVQYGALPEHYPLVGNALLTTFEQYLGNDWTPQVKQAWVEAYGAITEIMLSGADYDSAVVALDSVAAAEPETPVAESDTIDETAPEAAEETPTEAVAEPETTEESGLKVSLLENSFEQIKPRAGEFAASFYENLFRMYPAAQPLFANTDLAEQQKKLVASLVLVVENLRKPDALESPLKGLGARHVQYGALPEHYPLVGNALLTTFEQYLGNDWTADVKQAWVEAYGAITELMLSGADYDSKLVALDSVAAAEPETSVAESDTIAQTPTEAAAELNSTQPTQTVPKAPTVAEVAPVKPIEQPPSSMNFALFSGVFGSLGTIAIILLLLA